MARASYLVVALLSLTLIALELIWTRLFSAEFYYTFAFLILSLAVLGLGLGALAVRLWAGMARPGRLPAYLTLTGVAALAGPPLVMRLGLDFSQLLAGPAMIGRFLGAVALLASAFVFGGMALALVFRGGHRDMPRLYRADLLGAGGGVVVAVAAMNLVGTPAATFLCAAPVLAAAVIVARGWRRLLPVAVAAGMGVLVAFAGALLAVPRKERAPVTYTHWDAMAKIKLYDMGDARAINIDNLANTTVIGFDGDWDREGREPFGFGIDVERLIARFPRCTFVSLGAGGGQDVLQALEHGAAEVHAVEVNGHINRMLLDENLPGFSAPVPAPAGEGEPARVWPRDLASFSGHIYRDPRVRVVTEDARAYIGRHRGRFDVIYSLSSNTFAALASGAFALAENYLFTTEAFQDYWRALSPGGFLVMEHQFYMPRLAASVMDALRAEGVADPAAHIAIYDLPKMRRNLLLLGRAPLTDELRRTAFGDLTPEVAEHIYLLFPPAAGKEGNVVDRVVRDGWRAAQPEAAVDVSPSTDDRPFVGQMGLWKNVNGGAFKTVSMLEVKGFPLAKLMILTILAVVLGLLVPLNLVPYLRRGPRLGAAPWLYFFTIGAAFMIVEVVQIQRFTRFVGPSVWAVAAILLTLLVASGLGARFADRVPDRLPFLAVAGWILLDVTVLSRLVDVLAFLPLAGRVAVTVLLVAPLGFFMGMPFPKAALRVGELVDWGFAVNGAASVLGATGVLLLAFQLGLSAALLAGGALYLVAWALLARPWGHPAAAVATPSGEEAVTVTA